MVPMICIQSCAEWQMSEANIFSILIRSMQWPFCISRYDTDEECWELSQIWQGKKAHARSSISLVSGSVNGKIKKLGLHPLLHQRLTVWLWLCSFWNEAGYGLISRLGRLISSCIQHCNQGMRWCTQFFKYLKAYFVKFWNFNFINFKGNPSKSCHIGNCFLKVNDMEHNFNLIFISQSHQ